MRGLRGQRQPACGRGVAARGRRSAAALPPREPAQGAVPTGRGWHRRKEGAAIGGKAPPMENARRQCGEGMAKRGVPRAGRAVDDECRARTAGGCRQNKGGADAKGAAAHVEEAPPRNSYNRHRQVHLTHLPPPFPSPLARYCSVLPSPCPPPLPTFLSLRKRRAATWSPSRPPPRPFSWPPV